MLSGFMSKLKRNATDKEELSSPGFGRDPPLGDTDDRSSQTGQHEYIQVLAEFQCWIRDQASDI